MSFNIRHGQAKDGENHWDKRKQMVFDVIRNYSPDAVGLQEAKYFQIEQLLEALPEYDFVGCSREGKDTQEGEFSCIFYKKAKFKASDVETFWLSDTPNVPSKSWGNKPLRICTKVMFTDKQTQQSFYLYNTHFDHKSTLSRINSAELMVRKMKAGKPTIPLVFMGDLNAQPTSKPVLYLQENNTMPLVDSHFVLHPDDKETGTFSGFKFNEFNNKIDYIFIEKNTADILQSEIIRYSVNQRYPSDHFPVYVELQFR